MRKKIQGSIKRRLIRTTVVVLGVIILLAVALSLLVQSYITQSFLEESIEKSINSDVEIADVDVSIFSFPAKLTLTDVTLSHKGTATGPQTPIKVEEIVLRVGVWSLLRKHLNVTNIIVRNAEIHTIYHEDGSTSIEKLFEAPDGKKRTRKTGEKGGGLNVFEQADFVATLGGFTLENSKVNITLEEMGLRLQCLDVGFTLDSIKIDPKNLAKTNNAKLEISSHIRVDSTEGWRFGDFYLSGLSSARIFNPVTGDAEPDIDGDFDLGEESWINTRIPFITRSWNHLTILEKVGIQVAQLPEKATFGRSEAIAAKYHQGKVTVNKPLSLWVGDWELAMLDQSWLQTQTDQHEIHAELLASKSMSVYFRSIISKGVELLP
ncbi:MAG: AsmA family protein, partial [Verrucomicrobiae bacterium]|nr:AsmA family protein [Verrucomicrobiae bacterium]NNJ86600.1 AsmA family protein [Akkermansiaceae bacterium]